MTTTSFKGIIFFLKFHIQSNNDIEIEMYYEVQILVTQIIIFVFHLIN